MLKSSLVCLFLGLIFSVHAQDFQEVSFHSEFENVHFQNNSQPLAKLLMADATVKSIDYFNFREELSVYINGLQSKQTRFKKEKDFVSHVFYKTHRKYLKRYVPFTTLGVLAKTGKYDCLSATSLYSYLFTKLGVHHSIIETNYHIYIKVSTSEGDLLIESTDAIYGFVERSDEIKTRLKQMDKEESQPDNAYRFTSTVNEIISPTELIGLQYYNQAVSAFNEQRYSESIDFLLKGLIFRNNPRTIEFGLVLAQGIMKDDRLDQNSKLTHITRLQRLLHDNIAVVSR
ncbi:MAG: hypothetical protein AAGF85_05050 [Bacteroidota bacterium]